MAVGLSRAKTPTTKAGPALIGAAAVGLLGAGAFKTDPVSGYPPGTPDAFTRHTAHGALHDLLSAPTFLGLPAAALVYARAFRRDHERGWAAYSAATGAGMLDVRLGQRRVQPGAGPRALWRADPACLHHPGVLVADRSRASRASRAVRTHQPRDPVLPHLRTPAVAHLTTAGGEPPAPVVLRARP